MTDPFESLRHHAEGTGSTAIDPRFRAELLDEARRRLSSDASAGSIRPRAATDTPTPIPMEPIPMLAKNPRKTRPLLLAAACAALVAAGIVAVVALKNDDVPGNAQHPSVDTPAAAPGATAPPTPTPAQTPTTVASTSTTTVSPVRLDRQMASSILLTVDEYAPGWQVVPTASVDPSSGFDPDVASGLPECAPFVENVFGVVDDAGRNDLNFYHPPPSEAAFGQFVIVLPDVATARAVFDIVNTHAFGDCSRAYATKLGSGGQWLPIAFERPVSPAPFEPVGDDLVYRTYDFSWVDDGGITHGPETAHEAAMRIGRTITFIGILKVGEDGVPIADDAQFRQILLNIQARTDAALAGTPFDPAPRL